LLYEKRIASLPRCLRELRTMDLDSGLRIRGRYNGRNALLFVTKSGAGYAVAIYGIKRKGKATLPEKQLLIEEFKSDGEVGKLITQTATRPLNAYSY
jgi:hypothetical protein